MVKINTTGKDQIIFVGDIHGRLNTLMYLLANKNINNAFIIQVGDFGVGFLSEKYYRRKFKRMSDTLGLHNNHLLVIRGNHDDPEYFSKSNNPYNVDNITFMSDYSEHTLLGKRILFVGGAISVDRLEREEYKDWWEDEAAYFRKPKHKKYDIVVTHTRPPESLLFNSKMGIESRMFNDPGLEAALDAEGHIMTMLRNAVTTPLWIFGHFHESLINVVTGTKYVCCNIDEFYPYNPTP